MPAQQKVEWKQTVNMPKGANLPNGVSADILGLELGDSYAEIKTKLEKLAAEAKANPGGSAQLSENEMQLSMALPGNTVTAQYVSVVNLNRNLVSPAKIREEIVVQVTSPASGQQAIAIRRTMVYANPTEQPSVSELLAGLKAKYQAMPFPVAPNPGSVQYRLQWDKGRPFTPAKAARNSCIPTFELLDETALRKLNSDGQCNVSLNIDIMFGLSEDRAKEISFKLGDNERWKANGLADAAFMRDYARAVQGSAKGAAPKL